MSEPCCGFGLVGDDWGTLEGTNPSYSTDACVHVTGERYCSSCSTHWYRLGADDSWDMDGCASAICPECVALGFTDDDGPAPTSSGDGEGEVWRGGERGGYEREQMARIQHWR